MIDAPTDTLHTHTHPAPDTHATSTLTHPHPAYKASSQAHWLDISLTRSPRNRITDPNASAAAPASAAIRTTTNDNIA